MNGVSLERSRRLSIIGCLSLALAMFFLCLMPVFLFDTMQTALVRLRRSPTVALLAVLGMFLGCLVNIPLYCVRREEEQLVEYLAVLGVWGWIPRFRRVRRDTLIAVNLGGCVIPSVLALWQIVHLLGTGGWPVMALAVAVAGNILACYLAASPVEGVGIFLPGMVSPAAALGLTWLLLWPLEIVDCWQATAPEVQLSSALLEGFAPDVLREQMSGKADLVVMATHGLGPLSRFWLGSVADALVRTATVPVLLLRPSEQPPPVALAPPFRHMLIPLDGSEPAEQALEPALQLGRFMEASYILLRVVKPVVMLDPNLRWPATARPNEILTRQALDEAQAYLNRIAERLREQGLSVRTRTVLHTHAAEAILQETRDADVIALATHGRGGLPRLLLGSVADKVLRGGTTPMLVCRPRDGTT